MQAHGYQLRGPRSRVNNGWRGADQYTVPKDHVPIDKLRNAVPERLFAITPTCIDRLLRLQAGPAYIDVHSTIGKLSSAQKRRVAE